MPDEVLTIVIVKSFTQRRFVGVRKHLFTFRKYHTPSYSWIRYNSKDTVADAYDRLLLIYTRLQDKIEKSVFGDNAAQFTTL